VNHTRCGRSGSKIHTGVRQRYAHWRPAREAANGFTSDEKARWVGYIGVDDVELFSKRVQQAGGILHRAAEEIPNVGTFAVVADPQGAIFVLFQPLPGMTRPEQPSAGTQGMPAWHELAASDRESDFQFYADLFGWTKAHAVDMARMGFIRFLR
jgi:uncharacterized protein